jgi:hypothetical protein
LSKYAKFTMPMPGMVEVSVGDDFDVIAQQLRVGLEAGKAKSRARGGRLFLSRETKIGFT